MRTWATLLCLTTEDELALAIIPHLIHFESCCLGIRILPSAYLLFNHSRVTSRSRFELERLSSSAPQTTPSCLAPIVRSLSASGASLADPFFSGKTGKRANLHPTEQTRNIPRSRLVHRQFFRTIELAHASNPPTHSSPSDTQSDCLRHTSTMKLDVTMQIIFGILSALIAVFGIWLAWRFRGKSLTLTLQQ
jgi:hypothetical protein